MYREFDKLSGNAKIWIYHAGRALNETEQNTIEDAVRQFCIQWKAHGKPFNSSFRILYDRFLVLAADDSMNPVSGCSIDESIHFIKGLSEKLHVDFLDRNRITIKDPATGELFSMTVKEAKEKASTGEITGDHLIFNSFVANKAAIDALWVMPVINSWLKNYLDKKVSI